MSERREPCPSVDGNEAAGTGQWAQLGKSEVSFIHSFAYSSNKCPPSPPVYICIVLGPRGAEKGDRCGQVKEAGMKQSPYGATSALIEACAARLLEKEGSSPPSLCMGRVSEKVAHTTLPLN